MKKYIPYFLSVIIITFTLLSVNYLRKNNTTASIPNSGENGLISFCILNGPDDVPLKGAKVVIPEANVAVLTSVNGCTPVIPVPILYNSNFDNINKQPWGEISVLVYKKGYADFAMFHVQVRANKPRGPVELLLFPKNDNTVFSLVEGPPNDWVKDILNKYRNHSIE